MHAGVFLIGTASPPIADCRDRLRRPLDRRALHIVLYAADTAHLFAAAGSPGTSVYQVRQGRPVACRLGSTVAVNDDHATMEGGRAENELARDPVIIRDDRARETAFAHARELDRLVEGGFGLPRSGRGEISQAGGGAEGVVLYHPVIANITGQAGTNFVTDVRVLNRSGAAAMVMARRELAPDGHTYLGSVSRAATEFNKLCRGQMDQMMTDTRTLLSEGLKLASKTFSAARIALGWVVAGLL